MLFLFVLGLIAGSFLNVIVYRTHKGQSFARGRSQCESCSHPLSALDLVPVLSWLGLRGRCRYCRTKISWQHPAIELITGLVFGLSYVFWPTSVHANGQVVLFVGWLMAAVGLIALAVYDLRWMLLPNKIIYPTLLVAVVSRSSYLMFFEPNRPHALFNWFGGVVVASGLFLALHIISSGKWIGFGDVRLGLVTGTLLADPLKAFLMVFAASLLGSLAAFGLIIFGQKSFKSKIAYGPFLIAATFLSGLFGQSVIDWYNRLFTG